MTEKTNRRVRGQAVIAAAVASLAWGAGYASAEDVVDWHTFRAATATPLTGQGTNDPVVGNLAGGTADAAFVIGYLGTPLSLLSEHDQISYSFAVRFNDLTAMANAGDNFRFALFDENSQTRVTANETATAGVDEQTDDYRGYIFGAKNGSGTGSGGSTRERIAHLNVGDNAFAATGDNGPTPPTQGFPPTVTATQGVGGDPVVLAASANGNNTGPTYVGNMTLTKTAAGITATGVFIGSNNPTGNIFTFVDTTAPTSSTFGAVGYLVGDALNVEEVSFQDVTVSAVPTTRYWDIDGSNPGAGGATPSGNWNGTTGFNFNSDSAGGAGVLSAVTTPTSNVIFSAGAGVTGPYTVTVSGTQSAASVSVAEGDVTLTGGTLASGTFDVAAGASGTVSSTVTGGPSGSVTKNGPGTLKLTAANAYTGGTNVNGGTLQVNRMHENNAVVIGGGSTLRVAESAPGLSSGLPSGDNAAVSRPSALLVGAGGTLDLTNNDLILDYTDELDNPAAAIEAKIAQGYNGGDWLGTGITSSVAQQDGNFALAIADNALLTSTYGSFDGLTVDATTVLVKFTWVDDLDLDGLVTSNDAIQFGNNYSLGDPATHMTGDMDYDGVFTTNDAILFGNNYDTSLPSLPEPGSLSVVGLAGLGLCRRRRRGE
jgi:autotransporter-associated beta strand protein